MSDLINDSFTVSGLGTPETAAQYFELREPVIFPFGLTPVAVDGTNNNRAVDVAMKRNRLLAVFYEMPVPAEAMGFPFTVTLPTLPEGGNATFRYAGKDYPLASGTNSFVF